MPFDPQTGEFFTGTLEEFRKNIMNVGGLYSMAFMARSGVLSAYWDSVLALVDAQAGGLMYTDAAVGTGPALIVLPAVAYVSIFVAMGAPYWEAEEAARNENLVAGFAEGFVAGLEDWKWHHVAARFGRRYLHINEIDEQMNLIRVSSYNGGLKVGFIAAVALPAEAKKGYRRNLRSLAGVEVPTAWSSNEGAARNEQISYVIALAGAGLVHHVIRPR